MKKLMLILVVVSFSFAQDTIFISKESSSIYLIRNIKENPNSFLKLNYSKDSADCICVEHSFNVDANGNTFTLVKIKNHIKKDIKFDAFLFGFKNKKWIYTSSCPLMAQKSSYESWPMKIDSLLFTNFRYIEIQNSMECK